MRLRREEVAADVVWLLGFCSGAVCSDFRSPPGWGHPLTRLPHLSSRSIAVLAGLGHIESSRMGTRIYRKGKSPYMI